MPILSRISGKTPSYEKRISRVPPSQTAITSPVSSPHVSPIVDRQQKHVGGLDAMGQKNRLQPPSVLPRRLQASPVDLPVRDDQMHHAPLGGFDSRLRRGGGLGLRLSDHADLTVGLQNGVLHLVRVRHLLLTKLGKQLLGGYARPSHSGTVGDTVADQDRRANRKDPIQSSVETNESLRASRVVVPDNQLSLAIGRGGQNVRLASRLTGWKIDIKPESEAMKSLSKEAEDRLEELAKQNEITDFSDFEDIE